jgi:hypothetical protein
MTGISPHDKDPSDFPEKVSLSEITLLVTWKSPQVPRTIENR